MIVLNRRARVGQCFQPVSARKEMNYSQLKKIKAWFTRYTRTFASSDGRFPPPLQLKMDHSQRVADNARQLAEALNWSPAEATCAEALGWLHDVGRFSQFAEFGTFTDATSINHGERGWKIVRESNIPSTLQPPEQKILLEGIRYHNAKTEPDHLDQESLRFLKLIRDADKLDIFYIVLESVHRNGFKDLPDMLPQVVLNGPTNPKIIHEIQTRQTCSIVKVRSLTDFLLMQLSWIYDLNYSAAFHWIANLDIIGTIEQLLPKELQIGQIVQAVRRFVEHNLSSK